MPLPLPLTIILKREMVRSSPTGRISMSSILQVPGFIPSGEPGIERVSARRFRNVGVVDFDPGAELGGRSSVVAADESICEPAGRFHVVMRHDPPSIPRTA